MSYNKKDAGHSQLAAGLIALGTVLATAFGMGYENGKNNERDARVPDDIEEKVEMAYQLTQEDYARLKANDAARTCESMLRDQFDTGDKKKSVPIKVAEEKAQAECVQAYLAAPVAELNGQG